VGLDLHRLPVEDEQGLEDPPLTIRPGLRWHGGIVATSRTRLPPGRS
jgi:hypothetical protein